MKQLRHSSILSVSTLAIIAGFAGSPPGIAQAQDAAALTKELRGEAEAQTRTPEQMQSAYTTVLDSLLPDMSSDDMAKRGAAQQTWENIALRAGRPGADAERLAAAQAMIAKTGAGTPLEARLWLLKELQHIGRAESVPTLAGLLNDADAQVKERARRALADNRSDEAAQALRAALDKADTPQWRVAIINALGYRRDAASAGTIGKLAGDANEMVAHAAISALGRIGGAEANATWKALKANASPKMRVAVVDAQLRSAEQLIEAGQKDQAAAIYQELYVPAESAGNRIAGLRGLVAARGVGAIPLLAEVLKGDDAFMRTTATRFVADIPGTDATTALAALVGSLPDAGQAALIGELGTRGDAAARAAIVGAVKSQSPEVRTAALRALGSLGSAADITLLAQIAATAEGDQGAAARDSLARLRGQDINLALVNAMKDADPKVRAELIGSLAARRAADVALPALMTAITDADAATRIAAIKGLGSLGSDQAVQPLINVFVKSTDAAQRTATEKALGEIYNRMSDKSAGAAPVLAALGGASVENRRSLLSLLRLTGGPQALDAVRAATRDANADVRDAAIRSLVAWPDAVAAADVLDIARTAEREAHKVLALQGYARLAGVGDRSAADRVRMYNDILTLAKRPEEKRLALSGLGDVKAIEALQVVRPLLSDESVAEEAAAAAVKIAQTPGLQGEPDVRTALEKVLEISKNPDTTKAASEVLRKLGTAKTAWNILGPFPNEGGAGYDKVYQPEAGVDLAKAYTGAATLEAGGQ